MEYLEWIGDVSGGLCGEVEPRIMYGIHGETDPRRWNWTTDGYRPLVRSG